MNKIRDKFQLEGKVAIVTGSSKGIGESIARGLAEFGAKVVLSSRKQEAVDITAMNFKRDGLEATAIACHVGHQDQLENLVQKTVETYGGVDILVNNAAINPVFGPLHEVSEEAFNKIVNVNLKACFSLSNLCYPIFKERGGGSIINIASVESYSPSTGLSIYSISKAALIMLSKSQAKEWGTDGIRSNAICPGLIKTKLSSGIWSNEKALQYFERNIPLGRIGEPDEMAGLAVFLASDAASYCTGGAYVSDGGYLI